MVKFCITQWALCLLGFHFAFSWDIPFRREMEVPDLRFNPDYHIGDKITYASCQGDFKINNCTIYREKFPFQDPPYVCKNIIMKTETKEGMLTNELFVVPFGEDKSVVVWSESDRPWCLKLITIKMDSCQTSETVLCQYTRTYPHTRLGGTFVPYDDYYDVIFKNRTMCKDSMCRITFDADSNVVNGPHPAIHQRMWLFDYHPCYSFAEKQFSPLSPDSLDKGLFYVGQSQEGNDIFYNYTVLHRDGSETSIDKIKENNSKLVTASTANGIIGVCYAYDNTFFNCTQYYENGTVEYNLPFTANEPWKYVKVMYNLPDGGFIIVARNNKDLYNYFRYTLVKVNSNTQTYKTLEISQNYNAISDPQVFVNEYNEYCVSAVGYRSDSIDLYANCFNDSDFVEFNLAIPKEESTSHKLIVSSNGGLQILFNPSYHREGQLAYALCTKSEQEKYCTVVREKSPFRVLPYSCNITLRPEMESSRLGLYDPLDVVPFGEDNVVISWSESDMPQCLKLTTIKMSTCNTNEALLCQDTQVFPYRSNPVTFVTYNDYFDVIFENRTACQDLKCIISFDADGKIINGPIAAVHQHNCVEEKTCFSPLSIDSQDKEIFYIGWTGTGSDIIYNYTVIHTDGSETSLGHIGGGETDFYISTSNGIIGACYLVYDSLLNCNQYYGNGTVKHSFQFSYIDKILGIYNLPAGGLLVSTVTTRKGHLYFVSTLMKVNSDGQVENDKKIEIPYYTLKSSEQKTDAQVFLDKNQNYCFSFLEYSLNVDDVNHQYLYIHGDCFAESELL